MSRKVERLARPKSAAAAGPRGGARPAMLRRLPLRPRVEMRDVVGAPEAKPKHPKTPAAAAAAGGGGGKGARAAGGRGGLKAGGRDENEGRGLADPPLEGEEIALRGGTSREDEYRTLKAALMAEIVAGRMYEEDRLAALFRRYLRSNSGSAQDVLQDVLRDLQVELDVAQS